MGIVDAVFGELTPSVAMSISALLLLILWFYQSIWIPFVQRRVGEPPLLSGSVPWWGCAGSFGANPCQFVRDMSKKHGKAFTVVAAGNRVLLLCDYRYIKAFFRQSRTLSASELKLQMAGRVFGERVVSSERILEDDTRASYTKYLAGAAVDELSSSYQDVLRAMFCLPEIAGCDVPRHNAHDIESEFDIGPSDTAWKTLDLSHFVAVTGYASAVDAIFGDGAYNPDSFDDYLKFDENFLLMLGGLPSWLPSIADSLLARKRLVRHLARKRKNMSALMSYRQEQFSTSSGVDSEDLNGHNAAFLFGLVANTSPAQFWTLLLLLKDPLVLAQIKDEIRVVMGDGWTEDPAMRHLSRDPDELRKQLTAMVKLDSVINEMFRTCSAPLVGRIALEDCSLELFDRTIKIRKGDRVCLVTHTIHNDENIYGDNTEDFQWDRYLTTDRENLRKFTERDTGRSVQHYLLPFGGGVSMCPGRYFARDEIKIYIATLLATFDVEDQDPLQEPPKFDFARSTIGVIPPDRGDVFKIRFRRQTEHDE